MTSYERNAGNVRKEGASRINLMKRPSERCCTIEGGKTEHGKDITIPGVVDGKRTENHRSYSTLDQSIKLLGLEGGREFNVIDRRGSTWEGSRKVQSAIIQRILVKVCTLILVLYLFPLLLGGPLLPLWQYSPVLSQPSDSSYTQRARYLLQCNEKIRCREGEGGEEITDIVIEKNKYFFHVTIRRIFTIKC